MAILINFFDNVILQAISEEIVPKVSFFKETLWTRTQKADRETGC